MCRINSKVSTIPVRHHLPGVMVPIPMSRCKEVPLSVRQISLVSYLFSSSGGEKIIPEELFWGNLSDYFG